MACMASICSPAPLGRCPGQKPCAAATVVQVSDKPVSCQIVFHEAALAGNPVRQRHMLRLDCPLNWDTKKP